MDLVRWKWICLLFEPKTQSLASIERFQEDILWSWNISDFWEIGLLALKEIFADILLFIFINIFLLLGYCARPVQICNKSPLPKVFAH